MNDRYVSLFATGNYSFLYTPTSLPTKETEDYFNEEYEGCECSGPCRPGCPCFSRTGTIYEDGKVLQINDKPSFECNVRCTCTTSCSLRLVQFGPNSEMDVRWTMRKGYGLFATADIPENSFVCEYAGEVISKLEAEQRFHNNLTDTNYIFWAREHFGSKVFETIIDPTAIGNIGRFVNHSCNANCNLMLVRIESSYPKLCLFSNKVIEPEEEITFDYGSFEPMHPFRKKKPCFCGAANCTGVLPFHEL